MSRVEQLREFFWGLFAGGLVLGGVSPAWALDVHVDPNTKYQTLKGWEAILSGLEVNETDGSYSPDWVRSAPEVMEFLVDEMGINRVRIELHSGSENRTDHFARFRAGEIDYDEMKSHFYEKVNDDADPAAADPDGFHFGLVDFRIENELLRIKQAVEANGEKLYISVCYVDFASGNQGSLRHGTTPAEYAELVAVFFDHLKTKYQITPDALEIILEPENTADWNDGGKVGRGAVAAAARLAAAGYHPELIAPSTVNASNAVPFFNAAVAVDGAANLFSMLSYHRYGAGDYAAIHQAAATHGVQTGMLEFFTASVDDLVQDLTVANVSAWEKYAIAAPKRSSDYAYLYADVSNPADPSVTFGTKAAQMMPYFRFARLGAVRVGAKSASGSITPVAFVNTNGTQVLVVKGDAAELRVTGMRDAAYGVTNVANDGRVTHAADVTASGGVLNVTVPAGVTAIHDKDATQSSSGGTGGTSGSGGANAGGAGSVGNAGTNAGASSGGAVGGEAGTAGSLGTGGTGAGQGSGSGGAPAAGAGTTGAAGKLDAGRAAPDVGGKVDDATVRDAGDPSSPRDGGNDTPAGSATACGCRLVGSTPPSRSLLPLAALWLVAFRVRLRRSREP